MNKRSFFSTVLALGMAATAVAGCSSSVPADTAESAVGAEKTAQALGPIIKDPTALDGTTVTLPVERELVFNVPEDSDITAWTATIDDPTVAEFVAGTDDGSATLNPGIHPLAESEGTTVTLTAPDGTTSTFTLIITPGSR